MVRHRPLPAAAVEIEATEPERAALAARFGITAIDRLVARITLTDEGPAIDAVGTFEADLIQPCAVSGEDFAVHVSEPIALRFVPRSTSSVAPEAEIELEADQLDEIEYEGEMFDLGEAVAQSLGLAIDPYAVGPEADRARLEAGVVGDDAPRGSLADALAKLKRD